MESIMKFSRGRSSHGLETSYSSNKSNDSTAISATMTDSIYSQPTASESYDVEDNTSVRSESETSADSEGLGLRIPTGYLSPSHNINPTKISRGALNRSGSTSSMKLPTIKDEDRLLLLAKHPHVTEGQVMETLYRKQLMKEAKEQQQRQQHVQQPRGQQPQQQQHHLHNEGNQERHGSQVRFASTFPVDTDTGEAWERQARKGIRHSGANVSMTGYSHKAGIDHSETSFDRVWALEAGSIHRPPTKKSALHRFWRKIFKNSTVFSRQRTPDRDESIISIHEGGSLAVSVNSDKTPKISNVDARAQASGPSHETRGAGCGSRSERLKKRLFGTRHGQIILGILLVLILAIIVTVVAAVISNSGDKNSKSTENNNFYPQAPGTFTPTAERDPGMSSPVSAPTQSPTLLQPTTLQWTSTLSPTLSTPNTFAPTLQPSLSFGTPPPSLMQSQIATSQPTSRSTTNAPTTNRPTSLPSTWSAASMGGDLWNEVGASLVGSEANQGFGRAISLSADGMVLAVGAPSATVNSLTQVGMVQVFEWSDVGGGFWQPRGLPILGRNEGDQFGSDVALSADGSILVASEPTYSSGAGIRSGNVRTFVYDTGGNNTGYVDFGQEIAGAAASDHFGISIALSADGKRLAVGAPYHDNGGSSRNITGQVSVYDYVDNGNTSGSWQLFATMSGSDHLDWFGWTVDLDSAGRVMCAGAPRNIMYGGYVECHDLLTNLILGQAINNSFDPRRYDDNFGYTIKISTNSSSKTTRVAIGAPGKNVVALDDGMVAVYEYNTLSDRWSIIGGTITSSSPQQDNTLGYSVDLQDNTLIVGSPGIQQVDCYTLASVEGSLVWEKDSVPLTGALNSTFGSSVASRGGRLAVGTPETPGPNTGMVIVFQR